MRTINYFIIILLFISCQDKDETALQESCEGDYSTGGILTDIDEKIFNDDESVNAYSIYSWSSDASSRILTGNGIPNHEVGIDWSGWSEDVANGKQGLQYGALTVPLIKAVQEQQDMIDSQREMIDLLIEEVKNLKSRIDD
tara:strand:- start:98 stop:520 length:423 start_codon:yes stop_codon:yes gene_type:complete